MDGEDAGKWLFIGLVVGVVLMLASYGVPPGILGIVAPDCGEACLKDLDLAAQQGMNTAAWMMFAATTLSVALGAAGLLFIVRTLNATLRATVAAERGNETMTDVARLQSRAYVDAIGGGIEFRQAITNVTINYANAGQSPARRLRIDLTWSFEKRPDSTWNLEKRDASVENWVVMTSSSGTDWMPALPPGDRSEVALRMPNLTERAHGELLAEPGMDVRYVARGALSYDDVFGQRHQERFQFRSMEFAAMAALMTRVGTAGLDRLPEPSNDISMHH